MDLRMPIGFIDEECACFDWKCRTHDLLYELWPTLLCDYHMMKLYFAPLYLFFMTFSFTSTWSSFASNWLIFSCFLLDILVLKVMKKIRQLRGIALPPLVCSSLEPVEPIYSMWILIKFSNPCFTIQRFQQKPISKKHHHHCHLSLTNLSWADFWVTFG